jgi:mannose-6-phosphate isomerase-like protein (cupin superfamily)
VDSFELDDLKEKQGKSGRRYYEFLRANSLSSGVYVLKAGDIDAQKPHMEDEIYYVVGGRVMIRVGDEERAVGPGSLIFVPATIPHKFYDIEQELKVLVFFSPPEHTSESPPSLK